VVERFSPHARQALAAAEREARSMKHAHVATEHLLLGLLKVEDCVAAQAFRLVGVTHRKARRRIVALVDIGGRRTPPPLPFTPRVREVIEDAFTGSLWLRQLDASVVGQVCEARVPLRPATTRLLGQKHPSEGDVRTEQLALALVAHGDGVAARVLTELGVDFEKLAVAVTTVRIPPQLRHQALFHVPVSWPPQLPPR
jgi:ATP-dependent Clp protease ATP-binding subunit ClpC